MHSFATLYEPAIVPVGGTPAASVTALYAWLDSVVTKFVSGRMVYVYGNPEAPATTRLRGIFHHLREPELQNFEQFLLTSNLPCLQGGT